ncbi:MAG: uracil-DNA glycosylase [Clostridia bacterium]|nr:uracil-DNA glycosylase [Clostridia bacterium]
MTEAEIQREWEELEERCKGCTKCPLCETRTNVVFGSGDRTAEIMFIGEAPGEKEDLSGTPFVGAAGKLLDKFLYQVDIDREQVFIANMLKCRPPKNRDPKEEEQDLCIEYLREQVRLIKPKIIVCLGRISAKRLIKEDFRITQEHGIFFEKNGYTICAVYHPAALLRDPRRKEDMLIDMQNIKKKLDELKD